MKVVHLLIRIVYFIGLLIISPFWILVGICVAFMALFGAFVPVDEIKPDVVSCPDEVIIDKGENI